ncbi:MAG: hypothetical protein WBP18_14525 [Paracoccaceae bacterium]
MTLLADVLPHRRQFPRNPAGIRATAADDRFIFRTTDRTLWFEADGSGAGAAIMVADLQAGAVVTAAEILLI